MKMLSTAPLLLAAVGYSGLANADPAFTTLNGSTESRLYLSTSAAGQDSALLMTDGVPDTIKFRVGASGKDVVVQYDVGKGWQTGCSTSLIRYDRSKLDADKVPFVVNKTVKQVEQGACRIPGLAMTLDGAATNGQADATVVVSRFYGNSGYATELNVAYTAPAEGNGVYGNVIYTDHSMPYVLSMK